MLESRVAVGVRLVVILLVLSNSSSVANKIESRLKHYLSVLHACVLENGITVETYAYASPSNNTDLAFERAKCVDLCMFNKLHVMKPNGDIDMEKALEHLLSGKPGLQRDNMKRFIETCDTTNLSSKCDVAHALMTCALGHY